MMMIRCFILLLGGMMGMASLAPLSAQEPITREYKQYYAAATAALENKELDRALEQINLAEADTPGKIPTLSLRGNIYIQKEEYDLAEKDFEAILAQYPDYPGAIYNLAETQFLKADYKEAKANFQRYLKIEGQERNALVRYKVFLCDLMMENDAAVKSQLKALQPTISHPLEYFCRAAVNTIREIRRREMTCSAQPSGSIPPPSTSSLPNP
jgi:tetratricopeptide (TPR) repeat protein